MSSAMVFGPVPPADFDADTFASVVAAATEADGAEPLNEAALLALRHHGLEGSTLFSAGRDGFAWVHGPASEPEVDLVVAPGARGQGVGAALADAVVSAFPDGVLSAWSHGNHPAAAALAARCGFARVRDLWVMRRPLRDLPVLDAPADEVVVRAFRPGSRRGGVPGAQRGGVRRPPGAGPDDARRPRPADERAVVRPRGLLRGARRARTAPSLLRGTCSGSTGPRCTRESRHTGRCTSSECRRGPRGWVSGGCSR